MITAADILSFLETIAPKAYKEEWDNVGLLCGRADKEVRTVLIALDPFEDVAAEAISIGADLIITHHPLIFRPLYSVTDATSVGRVVRTLTANDICAINAHTNLDLAPGGVNDVLANTLGLHNVQVVNPQGTDSQGREWGLLRMGTIDPMPLKDFLGNIKDKLGTPCLRYTDGGKQVSRVAVGGGACADEMQEAIAAGCDTFVTADVKYNGFWDAHDQGLNLIDAGHFYTENPVCAYLKEQISAAFPETAVKISASHRDCMKFF